MLIRVLTDFDQEVCLIGGGALEERAAGMGLSAADRVAPPLGLTARCIPGLRAYLRDRGDPDLVHCWSPGALAAAGAASRAPLCATFLGRPGAPGFGAARLRRRGARAVVFEQPELWSGALGLGASDLSLSGLPRLELRAARGAEARRRLGIKPGECVVWLVAGEPGEADAMRLAFEMGLLWESGARPVWVVPGSAARLARGLRFHARSAWPSRLIVTDRPVAEQIGIADVGLWLGGPWSDAAGEGPSPAAAALIGMAMRAGVPVVAPRANLAGRLYTPDAAEICTASNGTIAEVARILGPLTEDAGLRARAAHLAREVPPDGGEPFEVAVARQWSSCLRASSAQPGVPI
jgi:hypothetical protein